MIDTAARPSAFAPPSGPAPSAAKVGFRFGDKGTHTSRTMMLAELTAALAATPSTASRAEIKSAIVEGNCLGKATTATRRLTNQRLGELYGLDLAMPLFRILRRLWGLDESGRAQLALLVAIVRDPLLAATAAAVLPLPVGAALDRKRMKDALRDAVGTRLNDSILDKVIRNAASSWTQSGHLAGRMKKTRRAVEPTVPTLALALYLGEQAGFHGEALFESGYTAAIDCSPSAARTLALEAKRRGLIDLRLGGGVVDLHTARLDPGPEAK